MRSGSRSAATPHRSRPIPDAACDRPPGTLSAELRAHAEPIATDHGTGPMRRMTATPVFWSGLRRALRLWSLAAALIALGIGGAAAQTPPALKKVRIAI